jgi:hypothetical protein
VRRLAALGGALVLVLVLVFGVGQLVLPGIAASTLRDRLSRSGRVLSVSVSAFPAIELLWHDADRVVVRMASYHSSSGHLNSLLDQASGVGSLSASAQVLTAGLLTLRDASLIKRGSELYGSARIEESDLRAAIPVLRSVSYVGGGNGGITLQGTADVFGAQATVPASVRPVDGRLVVTPELPLVGGIASVTVFADPRVRVDSVSGASVPGGLSVAARGRLQ